ncbi:hypothetical protein O181_070359 [Austropuccinia psidii MF-1]|uniref:Integrase catalytic domain-containing protein n=1 Tax=Austropuccinia psidii MF-1 TaxID=1389203 RepID=A0A9Q3F139_9BASI|nr:hypothetical protein [Austropuccinia psidii MF-1]
MSHLTLKYSHWHARLGNPSNLTLKPLGLHNENDPCQVCVKAKFTMLPFKGNSDEVHKPLDCLHLDLVGSISTPSASGHRYFLTIVDQFTSFKFTHFLKNKSDAFEEFTLLKRTNEDITR